MIDTNLSQNPRVSLTIGRKWDYASHVLTASLSIDAGPDGIQPAFDECYEQLLEAFKRKKKDYERDFEVELPL